MNKRIAKKIHKSHLIDVVYAVSVSSSWRDKIFNSDTYEKLIIDKFHLENIPNPLRSIISDFNLRYYVYKIPHHEAIGWEDWDDKQIYFKFEAVNFPKLIDFSANNPNVT